MLRAIIGGIAGYIVMFAIVLVGLSVAFMVMGQDKAFQAGTYDITMLWAGVMLAVGIVAAVLGGVACMMIAMKGSKAPVGLAVFVLVMGGLTAVMAFGAEDPGPRLADTETFEAASKAQQPVWTLIANPLIGAVGVILGAKLTGRCDPRGVAAANAPDAG